MIISHNFLSRLRKLLIVSALSLSVLSCGIESIITAGISGTGIVYGTITGFGSIFVNGIEYDIDEAVFDVDDGNHYIGLDGQSNLEIGMVVKLNATTYDNGTGLATSVTYDESIDGPIADFPVESDTDSNVKNFTILGQTVSINALKTRFKSENDAEFGFDTINKDDLVEVSGFVESQTNTIVATHIEKKGVFLGDSSVVQLHGLIENLSQDHTLFTINGIAVDSSQITLGQLKDIESLSNGLYVEVNGMYQGGAIQATDIEGEEDDLADIFSTDTGNFLSLEGLVSAFTSSSEFEVNGVPVYVDSSLFPADDLEQIKEGLHVEIYGEMIDGVLQVSKLEIENDDDYYDSDDHHHSDDSDHDSDDSDHDSDDDHHSDDDHDSGDD